MKKKHPFPIHFTGKCKLWLIAGYGLLLMILLSVSTWTRAQVLSTKITVSVAAGNLSTALEGIRNTSGVNFYYDPVQIRNIKVKKGSFIKVPVLDVMRAILKDTGLEFTENNGSIVIRRKMTEAGKDTTAIRQEKRTVQGIVQDSTGTGIPGVSVRLKNNSTVGTVSGSDGKFTLTYTTSSVPAVLVFSLVGYQPKELPVGLPARNLQVVLEDAHTELNEVIVIGYGVARRKDFTGAISSVSGEDVVERQNTQVSTSLQGLVPGLSATRSSSAPGTGGTLRVRGITSMRNNGPLIIIDGVPANNINDVNANDIENITVLKDAASASIYGARAAAGVILVTTRRGSANSTDITYNYSLALDRPSAMPDYADAVTYMKVVNEREWNGSGAVPGVNEYSIYDEVYINDYWTLNSQDPNRYPNTNWAELILKNVAPRQSHQLAVNRKGTRISLAYDNVEGLFRENLSWDRVSTRINNTVQINQWLEATADINLKKTASVNPAFSPSFQMRYAAPVYAALYSDGRLAGGKDGTNPYGTMMYGGTEDQQAYQAYGKFALNVKPLPDLVVTGVFAPIFDWVKSKKFTKRVPYYDDWDAAETTRFLDGTQNMDLTENRNDNHSYTTQLFANYTRQLGDHQFSAMAGYEDYYFFNESLMASRGQYALPYYPYLTAGPGDLKDNNGDAYENAYRSYFGRIMYNWKHRYYLQANVRRDGSSRFHKDHRWGTFPSFSAAWVVSEETFMRRIPFISWLKLRGSWGQLGDERIGNYTYQSNLEFNTPTLYVGNTPTAVQGASAYQYAIKTNTWETTTTTNIGLDLAVAKNRLSLTADYYRKKTEDMLIIVNIPDFMGYWDPYQNIGRMNTRGWELSIGWQDKTGELSYGVDFNIHDYKSVMGYIKGTQQDNKAAWTLIREGEEYLTYYGYLNDGIYQTGDEPGATTSSVVSAGDIRYRDLSGPDGVPDGIINDYDRVPLGGSLPRYNYGGNLSLGYKGIDFRLTVQGVGKQKAILTEQMTQPVRGDWYNVPEIILGNYWSHYNTDEQNRAATFPRIMRDANSNNYAPSDFWLFDGSYFRVKNITVGYTLPVSEKILLKNFRLFASLQDVFTHSHYPKGWDPEVSSTGYPITKSVLFGLSAKL